MQKKLSTILALFILLSNIALGQVVGDDYLNDLINLWNAHKYEKVYQPLKEYKASKKIENDFEIDYMILTSASRIGSKPEDVKPMVEDILKKYKFTDADAAYIASQMTPKKYVAGENKRADAEKIANRGKGEKSSKEVPRSLGKGDGKAEELDAAAGGTEMASDTSTVKGAKGTKGAVKGKLPAGAVKGGDIIRKPGITQIVKGDMVITVKPGWTYLVRNDSIFTMPPPRPKKK